MDKNRYAGNLSCDTRVSLEGMTRSMNPFEFFNERM